VANNKTVEQINTYSYVGCTLSYEWENCVNKQISRTSLTGGIVKFKNLPKSSSKPDYDCTTRWQCPLDCGH